MNRRDFIKYCLASGISFPLSSSTWANSERKTTTLVLIELQGGNDGLNTVVPYSDDRYYEYRPTLAMQENEIIKLNEQLGLHHSFESIVPLWQQNQAAIMLGVGYENPIFSHFRSIEIWDTASQSNQYLQNGWLAEILRQKNNPKPINGLVLGGNYGPLEGANKILQIRNIEQFFKQSAKLGSLSHQASHQMQQNSGLNKLLQTQQIIDDAALELKTHLKKLQNPIQFDKHPFGQQMALATQVIQSDLDIPVIKLRLGSFDTHVNQKPKHARLLQLLSDNINAMSQALKATGHWNKTTLMTYSEFGRRVKENGSKGTDHGTAAPHFIIGGAVKGGLKGKQPSLENLEKGNLIYTQDFHKIYKTII